MVLPSVFVMFLVFVYLAIARHAYIYVSIVMFSKKKNNCLYFYLFYFIDSSNSKYSNRRNGKAVNIQPQRVESNRNISFKKNSNNSKQPQPRASLFCRKKSSEVCK